MEPYNFMVAFDFLFKAFKKSAFRKIPDINFTPFSSKTDCYTCCMSEDFIIKIIHTVFYICQSMIAFFSIKHIYCIVCFSEEISYLSRPP